MTNIIFDSHKRWRNRRFYKPNWLMEAMYKGIREHMAFMPQTFQNTLVIHPYDDVLQTWLTEKGIAVETVENKINSPSFQRKQEPSSLSDVAFDKVAPHNLLGTDVERDMEYCGKNFPVNKTWVPASAGMTPWEGPSSHSQEDVLPLNPNTFDLILCPMNLQWVNDLEGYFAQILKALKPGGVFLAVCPGGESLFELRNSCLHVDMALGMVYPHTAPMLEVATGAHLLQRIGFKNPVADREILHHEYAHVKDLWQDLRAMGQTNGLVDRAKGLHTPRYVDAVQQEYLKHFKTITATFDMVYLTGWRG